MGWVYGFIFFTILEEVATDATTSVVAQVAPRGEGVTVEVGRAISGVRVGARRGDRLVRREDRPPCRATR